MSVSSKWSVLHGDTEESDTWAVVDRHGRKLFPPLSEWVVRAQVRDAAGDVVLEFTTDHGVRIGSATVEVSEGQWAATSTVQLYLDPGDYTFLPPEFTGRFGVRIELPDPTPGAAPQRRHTVVDDGVITVTSGTTR